jgi:hypothetical protein
MNARAVERERCRQTLFGQMVTELIAVVRRLGSMSLIVSLFVFAGSTVIECVCSNKQKRVEIMLLCEFISTTT